jgi:hypothetical protein
MSYFYTYLGVTPIILHWWLDPLNAEIKPSKKEVAKWIKFIKKNFEYIFNWGLGSVISLTMDENSATISLQRWPETGLPWIVFWLKELIVWGTLDPVVSHLLSHGIDFTRNDAAQRAENYYNNFKLVFSNDELLNASSIKSWAESFYHRNIDSSANLNHIDIPVTLTRKFKKDKVLRVLPLINNSTFAE